MLAATGAMICAAGLYRWRPRTITKLILALVTPIWLTILYFFRDPDRETLQEDGLVVAPADGEIVEIAAEREEKYLNREVTRVSIFLSLFDVHVQRVPLSGTVTLIQHEPGQFRQAFRPEASEVNEYIAMLIDSGRYGPILVKQIAGILARRCVNHQQIGDRVHAGDRFGLIRFSSRVDLFLPPDVHLLVAVGDKIVGGLTPITRL